MAWGARNLISTPVVAARREVPAPRPGLFIEVIAQRPPAVELEEARALLGERRQVPRVPRFAFLEFPAREVHDYNTIVERARAAEACTEAAPARARPSQFFGEVDVASFPRRRRRRVRLVTAVSRLDEVAVAPMPRPREAERRVWGRGEGR